MLVHCLACELYAQLLEDLDINIREHDRSVRLAAVQLRELGEGEPCVRVCSRASRERDQHFVRVQARVFAL